MGTGTIGKRDQMQRWIEADRPPAVGKNTLIRTRALW